MDFEAFTDFTHGSLRLMSWYARELIYHREPSVSPDEALDVRVDILRKTQLYDGRHPALGLDPPIAEWDELKGELGAILQRHADASDTGEMEASFMSVVWPLVEPGLEQAYEKGRAFSTGPFGCWRYAIKREPVTTVDLHFANAWSPESPFSERNRPRLVASLIELLDDACGKHPDAQLVHCGSWLNSFAPFLALFPAQWAETFSEWEYSSGTAGHWGQYMNRRGAFHQTNGEQLRRTGVHPYACGPCRCSVELLREHLREIHASWS